MYSYSGFTAYIVSRNPWKGCRKTHRPEKSFSSEINWTKHCVVFVGGACEAPGGKIKRVFVYLGGRGLFREITSHQQLSAPSINPFYRLRIGFYYKSARNSVLLPCRDYLNSGMNWRTCSSADSPPPLFIRRWWNTEAALSLPHIIPALYH